MYLRTEIQLSPAGRQFSHADRVLSVGSCFADRMGHRLAGSGFQTLHNPFGVIFHPLPMLRVLERARSGSLPDTASLVQKDGQWVSLEAHSALTAPTQAALLEQWQHASVRTHAALHASEVLILTFGTARGYFHPASDSIAANCHKLPAAAFEPRMTPLQEIVQPWVAFLNSLENKPLVILTVSPVRHVRDTLPVNSLSKALLRVACEEIVQQCSHAVYFPANELLTDDLRDYRFYADDLIHPSALAEGYIWDKFCGMFMSDATRSLVRQCEGLVRDLNHRPLTPSTGAHQQFLEQVRAKVKALEGKVYLNDLLNEASREGIIG